MSVISDVSELFFVTKGVQSVVADFAKMENAARNFERVSERAYYAPAGAQRDRAQQVLQDAVKQQAFQSAQRSVMAGLAAVGVIHAEIRAVEEAISAYEDFGKQVRLVQSLSGGSVRQSEQFTNLTRVAGISDGQSIREITRLAQDMRSGQGQQALSALGVHGGQNELQTFQQVIVALGKMQDGAKKTQLEVALFGSRGVQALQPLLEMSGDISEKTLALSASIDGRALQAITHFQQNVALLGQTFLNNIVYPIAQDILPVLDTLVTGIESVLNAWKAFNDATDGFGTFAVVVVGVAAGFGLAVKAVKDFGAALKALLAVEELQAVALAVIDALQGNYAALAVAGGLLAAGAAGAFAVNHYMNSNNDDKSDAGTTMNNAAQTLQQGAATFAGAVNGMARSLQSIAGSEISGRVSEGDLALILQRNAQGIG